jgi:hypothetical protein
MIRGLLILSATILVSPFSLGWGPFDHQSIVARDLVHFSERARIAWGLQGEYVALFSYNQNRDQALADSQLVRVFAVYADSRGTLDTLQLFDDGRHCDSLEGDKIYGNFAEGSPEELLTLREFEEFSIKAESSRLAVRYSVLQLGFDLQERIAAILSPVGGIVTDSCISILVATDTSFIRRDAAVFARSTGVPALDHRPYIFGNLQQQDAEPIGRSILCGEIPLATPLTLTVCLVGRLPSDIHGKAPVFQIDAVEFQRLPSSPSSGLTTLYQNHPNPFSRQTYLGWAQKEPGMASLYIADITGREVKNIFEPKWVSAGVHYATWDGLDSHRKPCSTGTYFVVLKCNGLLQARRLLLIR